MRRRSSILVAGLAAITALTIVAGLTPTPAAPPFSKINHFVVLMQENRSFDTMLGQLAAYDPTLGVEPEPTTGNIAPNGGLIKPFHKTSYCEVGDLDHSWSGTHKEWNGGAMDGFAKQNAIAKDPTGSRAMGYYNQKDLPFYYDLYDHFAMSDTYFSSVLSQTFPNRFYLLSGTSFGHIGNDLPVPPGANPLTDWSQPTIFERLDAAKVSWRIYFNEVPFGAIYGYVRTHLLGHVFPITQYYVDAALGLLPKVSFVDPIFIATVNVENDEHPPANIQNGQKFTSTVINALFKSPNWKDSALILTYDEHGGFYDHLPPPVAPKPDGIAPMLSPTDTVAEFDRLGIRVPFVVVSPWSKAHYVSSALPVSGDAVYANPGKVYSHTSILRTLEARFGMPPLTARDATSNDLSDFFDFSSAAYASAPKLKPAVIDLKHFLECERHEHLQSGV